MAGPLEKELFQSAKKTATEMKRSRFLLKFGGSDKNMTIFLFSVVTVKLELDLEIYLYIAYCISSLINLSTGIMLFFFFSIYNICI